MSKKLFSKVFILLLVVGLLFAVAPTKQAQAAATLCVNTTGADDCYTSIEAAIGAAANGDTITVAAGTYTETFEINKSVSLIGAGRDVTTIIAGEPTYGTIDVSAAGVTISGFKVTNTSSAGTKADGIYVMGGADNCTITQNEISGNGQNGISIVSSNNTVTNNIIAGNSTKSSLGAGVALFNYTSYTATGNTIQFNTITGNAGLGGIGSISSGTNDISKNWWGSATGPTHASNPGGTGDKIYTNQAISLLTYSPWLANPPVHNVTQGTYHATIQGAIDAAVAGDVIEVADGTYNYDTEGHPVDKGLIKITKPVTLKAADDGNGIRPVINASGAGGATNDGVFKIHATQFQDGLVVIEGFDITGIPQTGIAITAPMYQVPGRENTIIIRDNLIHGMIGAIDFWGNTSFVTDPDPANAVVSHVEITGNKIYDMGVAGVEQGLGVMIEDPKSDANSTIFAAKITDNEFYNFVAKDVSNPSAGVVLFRADAVNGEDLDVLIQDNKFGAGVNVNVSVLAGAAVTGPVIIENDFGNGGVGVYSVIPARVSGTPNWWGSVTGPAAGQMVGDVKYLPYCTNAACTTFSEAKLSMDPATINATTCGPQYVDVMVTDVADLTGYTLVVNFDKTKVHVDSVVNGGFLHETDNSIVVESVEDDGNTTGKLIIHAYLQAKPGYSGDPDPVSGSGSLIRINFTPLLGTTTFDVDESNSLLVGWPEVNPMPFSVTGGATATLTGGVVRNTNTSTNYCSLATAVAGVDALAVPPQTLQLLTDITLTETITIDKALTLDLNGKVATASTGINALNVTTGGALIVNDSGTTGKITGGKRAVLVNGGGSLTLTKGTLEGPGFDGVFVYGEGSSVTVNGGTITGLYYGISGNGSAAPSEYYGSTNILITGGTVQGGETAIFHPQLGPLTINGGEIIGGTYNGIEMKAGDLTITGGTITTSADFVGTPAQTSDGNTQSGDAILIYNRAGYLGTMTVNITGGTITSANGYALREYTYGSEPSRTTLVNISGGHFTGGTPGAVWFATNTELVMELVGGDYSADPITYVYTPYSTYQFGSRWYITKSPTITSNVDQGYYLAGEEKAFDVTMNLPAGGIDLALMIFDYKLAGVTTADITKFEFFAQDLGQWIVLGSRPYETYANCTDNTGICGQFGWAPGGFGPIAAGFTNTTQFRVTFAKGFTAPLSFTLDLSGKLAVTDTAWTKLTTYTGSLNVYDKPTATFLDLQKYFLTGDPQNFQVQFDNPITGGTYGHVVSQISIPAAAGDITSLKYDGTALALTCTTAPDVCTTTFDFGVTGGAPLLPSAGAPWSLELTAAKAGTYPMTFTLVDLDSDPDRPLQSAIGTAIVYNKPVITTNLAGPYNAGVPVAVTVNVDNVSVMFTPNTFELFLDLPEGTVVTYGASPDTQTVTCGASGCDPIVVTLIAGDNALPITVTFPGAYNAPISVELWDPDVTRTNALATYTTPANVVVNSGFTVTGNFSMQGNLSRAGVPVNFDWTGTLVDYDVDGTSSADSGTNLSVLLTYGGNYTITTLQPRYLNVYAGADFSKMINLTGDRLLPELRLRGGNAYWRVVDEFNAYTDQYDNTVNGSDASVVGTDWGPNSSSDLTINHGDVNFDGKVNIQDLALVGGNFGLTSADAYEAWLQ